MGVGLKATHGESGQNWKNNHRGNLHRYMIGGPFSEITRTNSRPETYREANLLPSPTEATPPIA